MCCTQWSRPWTFDQGRMKRISHISRYKQKVGEGENESKNCMYRFSFDCLSKWIGGTRRCGIGGKNSPVQYMFCVFAPPLASQTRTPFSVSSSLSMQESRKCQRCEEERTKRSKHTSSSAQRPTDVVAVWEIVYIRDCQQIGVEGEIRKGLGYHSSLED
jgi:hypothetical protein